MTAETKFDFVHADQLWMAPYALAARAAAQKHGYRPRLVLDQHNAVHLIPQRMAESARNPILRAFLQREARLMARYEARICQEFDHVVWVTAEDREAVRRHLTSNFKPQTSIIPICIDPASIAPITQLSASPNIFFLGGMHWPPNAEGAAWFAREVLPLVLARMPAARFFAVGKKPPAALRSKKGAGHAVHAPGYVENLSDYWRQGRVFVVPLSAGGGMRVKILDAWARGLPVVSTTIGAEGIAYRDGEDILIADSPQDFAEAVVRMLTDDGLAHRLGAAGRATVERCYDWRKVYKAWDEVYAGVGEKTE